MMKYTEEGKPDNEKKEDAGSINIAHAWTQQGHKNDLRHKIIIIG
jgi:hypothetical protein